MKFKNLVLVFVIGMMALMSCSNAKAASAEKQKNKLIYYTKFNLSAKSIAIQSIVENSTIDVSIIENKHFLSLNKKTGLIRYLLSNKAFDKTYKSQIKKLNSSVLKPPMLVKDKHLINLKI